MFVSHQVMAYELKMSTEDTCTRTCKKLVKKKKKGVVLFFSIFFVSYYTTKQTKAGFLIYLTGRRWTSGDQRGQDRGGGRGAPQALRDRAQEDLGERRRRRHPAEGWPGQYARSGRRSGQWAVEGM